MHFLNFKKKIQDPWQTHPLCVWQYGQYRTDDECVTFIRSLAQQYHIPYQASAMALCLQKKYGFFLCLWAWVQENQINPEISLNLAQEIAGFFNTPFTEKVEIQVDLPLKNFDILWFRQNQVMPLSVRHGCLKAACIDLTHQLPFHVMRAYTGYVINPVLTTPWVMNALWSALSPLSHHPKKEKIQPHSMINTQDHVSLLLEQMMGDALHKKTSDIHIDPIDASSTARIRMRMAGQLETWAILSAHHTDALINRIKVMSQMDIAERRLPQDGKWIYQSNSVMIEARVCTCPSVYGEKMTIRLFHHQDVMHLSDLGMLPCQISQVMRCLAKPHGMIWLTGPTGSGKSQTMRSLLSILAQDLQRNIIALEQPVEQCLPGVHHVNIQSGIGLTYAHALRSVLRQDPDVIAIGEVRDEESAHLAVQAAQTGHLVLATLHANTAIEVIPRLRHLGIASEDIADTASLFMAQRLVRRCLASKDKDQNQENPTRIALFECITLTPKLQSLIREQAPLDQMRQSMHHLTLMEAGLDHVAHHLTTLEEIHRWIG